jgi:DNA-binding LacI/PurR family transcriptional regulator
MKVIKAMRDLNCPAEAIRNGSKREIPQELKHIALIVPQKILDIKNSPLVSELIMHLTQLFHQNNCLPHITPLDNGKSSFDPIEINTKMSGALLLFERGNMSALSIPQVAVFKSDYRFADIDCVLPDNYAIGTMAYAWLKKQGCKHPTFMMPKAHMPFLERYRGFKDAAHKDGAEVGFIFKNLKSREPSMHADIHNLELADEFCDEFMSLTTRPDGLFIPADIFTVKISMSLQKHGIALCKDIPTISVDNEQFLLHLMLERPATFDLQIPVIAEKAVELLLDKINLNNAFSHCIVKVLPILVDAPKPR